MAYIITYVLFHLISGALAYAISFAYFQRGYPSLAEEDRQVDMRWFLLFGLCGGPIALLAAFFFSGMAKYGLKWK